MPNKDLEMKNAITAKKQQAAELAAAQQSEHEASIRERYRAAKREGKKTNRDELWKKLSESAERLQEGQVGYDTGIAAWSAIVTHLKLVVAYNKDIILRTIVPPVFDLLGVKPSLGEITGKIYDSIQKRSRPTTPPVDISDFKLQHFIEYKKAVVPVTVDTINIDSLTGNLRRSDGEQFSPEEAQLVTRCFKKGMDLWLDMQGYEPDPAIQDAYYLKTDHAVHLTKEGFEALRDDPTLGLNDFLSGRFDMNISQASGPRP